MPAKSGGSHAIAALLSMLAGTILAEYVLVYLPPLAEAAKIVGSLVVEPFGAEMSRELAGITVVVVVLTFVWGLAYHVKRHDDSSSESGEYGPRVRR